MKGEKNDEDPTLLDWRNYQQAMRYDNGWYNEFGFPIKVDSSYREESEREDFPFFPSAMLPDLIKRGLYNEAFYERFFFRCFSVSFGSTESFLIVFLLKGKKKSFSVVWQNVFVVKSFSPTQHKLNLHWKRTTFFNRTLLSLIMLLFISACDCCLYDYYENV